jgi:hypothetical protein
MVILSDLRRQIVAPGEAAEAARCQPHVGLPLSGRFKARAQEQQAILIPIAYETASGLRPGVWAQRLVDVLERCGVTTGWAFQTADGRQRTMGSFEEKFLDLLVQVHEAEPALFPGGIDVEQDFHLGRSHRRGATTRATAAGVAPADIEWINRWNIGMETGAGVPMRVLYADRVQAMDAFLCFSLAL